MDQGGARASMEDRALARSLPKIDRSRALPNGAGQGSLAVKRPDLETLLKGVRPANLHTSIDSGERAGKEAW